jgi:hypothetical protein
MVEQKIKQLFNTKTILHIDNPNHYDVILPLTTLSRHWNDHHVDDGDFCINFDCNSNTYATLNFYKFENPWRKYKFITSTELLEKNNIIELWD